jgi:hypothetical protein
LWPQAIDVGIDDLTQLADGGEDGALVLRLIGADKTGDIDPIAADEGIGRSPIAEKAIHVDAERLHQVLVRIAAGGGLPRRIRLPWS